MKIYITDHGFPNLDIEKKLAEDAGFELIEKQCDNEDQLIAEVANADGLLVQWAPITARVIEALNNCQVIVRYGIGVDNVDLEAAKARGIAVCNVPDYCIDEVADHTMALSLSLCRQLNINEEIFRQGEWKIIPPRPLHASRTMRFGTLGFGRIARAVLERARAFRFELLAYDPYVDESTIEKFGAKAVSKEELLSESDVLSLNAPLNDETTHFVNAETIKLMKNDAYVINTARGALIDTNALAEAINAGQIGGAGLDVYEEEPPGTDHPLFSCKNVILTSHIAWNSDQSVPMLQKLATEELIRGLQGGTLNNKVN